MWTHDPLKKTLLSPTRLRTTVWPMSDYDDHFGQKYLRQEKDGDGKFPYRDGKWVYQPWHLWSMDNGCLEIVSRKILNPALGSTWSSMTDSQFCNVCQGYKNRSSDVHCTCVFSWSSSHSIVSRCGFLINTIWLLLNQTLVRSLPISRAGKSSM